MSLSSVLCCSRFTKKVGFFSSRPTFYFRKTTFRFSSNEFPKRKPFAPTDTFIRRHIGPNDNDIAKMLNTLNIKNLEDFLDKTVPKQIRIKGDLNISPSDRGEYELLQELKTIASKNEMKKSFIGMGYYNTITPPVILRNVLENPAWYTPYTPYQAEISQGRLESLLNFQTMVQDLTGMDISNASLLDEATAAAEAMHMCRSLKKNQDFFVSSDCFPQTIEVIKTRAEPIGVNVIVGDIDEFDASKYSLCGAIVQYPTSDGRVIDYRSFAEKVKKAGGMVICATDLLSLTMLKPPGELGADIAVGSAQRFGVPMGYGGPHAAFLATKDPYKRAIPGRLIGVSKDSRGQTALRMALQTREQHIRREKASSNICTAQVLLANVAAMYAVYHGPEGLTAISRRVHIGARSLATALSGLGYSISPVPFFDTISIGLPPSKQSPELLKILKGLGYNIRALSSDRVAISLDETYSLSDLKNLLNGFASFIDKDSSKIDLEDIALGLADHKKFLGDLARSSPFLTHPVFNSHHSEHEMLRYIYRLQLKDIGLTTSMIPLGSCTMKLNATSEMIPITWPEFSGLHPFVPSEQAQGYSILIDTLKKDLAEITGFHDVSMQSNSGAQGEYTGLLVIRAYLKSIGQAHRNVCLIPVSAHGTNPASAIMAGFTVKTIKCVDGAVDIADLKSRLEENKDKLAALMVTYPSTYGVFEETIQEICSLVHQYGGQVYLDGANLNAQIGLCRPGDYGADVCHLNLHKTFCIPHGGGGPGMGPIAVAKHLAPFLPGHPIVPTVGGSQAIGPVSAAPFGSSSILPISYVYIKLMGSVGLKKSGSIAVLNANYMAKRLEPYFPILYKGKHGFVAHEFILNLSEFKPYGIEAEDIAKRLMDYSYHAPTMSFPVINTLMIEPTESEPLQELDRFIDSLISIRGEIKDVLDGKLEVSESPLKRAPHTQDVVMSTNWDRKYTREVAAFPLPSLKQNKVWPTVGRIDNVYGDRNLICSCPPLEDYH